VVAVVVAVVVFCVVGQVLCVALSSTTPLPLMLGNHASGPAQHPALRQRLDGPLPPRRLPHGWRCARCRRCRLRVCRTWRGRRGHRYLRWRCGLRGLYRWRNLFGVCWPVRYRRFDLDGVRRDCGRCGGGLSIWHLHGGGGGQHGWCRRCWWCGLSFHGRIPRCSRRFSSVST